MTTAEVIDKHRSSGKFFGAGGVRSFALDRGSGEPVVLLHGVPASSFLYRKVVDLLSRDMRAVAFDFPGLGLADRPVGYDYSWSGLARFTEAALDALDVERAHLVVHDIGGPIGFEFCIRNPDRVRSLTVLNAVVDVDGFRRTWTMLPFSVRGLGEVWLRGVTRPVFLRLMYLQGIEDRSATSKEEILAYYDLLKREDGGKAFLKIMRGFELTAEKERFFREGLGKRRYPAQVVWGADDPALKLSRAEKIQDALGVEQIIKIPAKHFLQEDQAPAVAERVRALAREAG